MQDTDPLPSHSKAGNPPAPRWPYVIAATGLALDQVTKRWFEANYAFMESRVVVPGFFNFTHARNPGAAFSLFQDHTVWLTFFSLVVFVLITVFRDHVFARNRWEQAAFGLILAGVLGNFVDRIKYGYVIDFIDWYFREWSWPIFNLADTWICVGVGFYLLSQGVLHKKHPAKPGTD